MRYFSLLYIILICTFLSCSTDFDITDDYREIMVVYGLLDQSDSVHVVRVNKGFLGDNDATVMALQKDSIFYGKELKVVLYEVDGNFVRDSFVLDTFTSISKEEGFFYSDTNILYKTNAKLDVNYTYRIVVTNQKSDLIVNSETALINDDNIRITSPSNNNSTINMTLPGAFKFKFKIASNASMYQLKIRFNYTENSVPKYLDWYPVNDIIIDNPKSGGEKEISINPDSFYDYIKDRIPVINGVVRVPVSFDFFLSAGTQDLYTYMQQGKVTSGIVQNVPQFSNVDGGIGLFTSRHTVSVLGKKLNEQTKKELNGRGDTKELNFVYP